MKTRRFDFDFKPLQVYRSISVGDSVPDRQVFSVCSGNYTPDYTMTPLCLEAAVSIIDKDMVLPAGSVNHKLANIKWHETINGTERLIPTTDAGYTIYGDGTANAGRILVKKNVEPQKPLTLRFEADFIDTRTGQLHHIALSHIIRTKAEEAMPVLELDTAPTVLYNPVRHPDRQTIVARLTIGGSVVPAASRIFVWEVMRQSGVWETAGSDILDYDVTVADDGASVTVDRTLIGDELNIRCRARYDEGGAPASVTLNDSSPMALAVITRRIPNYEEDMADVPYNIAHVPYIYPRLVVTDPLGVIPDDLVSRVFRGEWYMATNKASGTLAYSLIGTGIQPRLPTSLMSQEHGAVVGVKAVDMGPYKAWVDSDGSVITDADGAVILIK